jgi:hypothetical protein
MATPRMEKSNHDDFTYGWLRHNDQTDAAEWDSRDSTALGLI